MAHTQKDDLVKETIQKYKDYINPGLVQLLEFGGLDKVEWEGRGAIVRDVQGQEYIDCLGGYGVFTAGHCHPKIVAAVKEQLERMPLSSRVLFNKPQADLAQALAEITPGELRYSFFGNSGAEAVEGSIKLARLYTGKPEIIATINAFHGKTFGALSASGRDIYKKPFGPLLPGFKHVEFSNAQAIEKAITDQTAAVILEPIQAEAGVIIPSDDYLPEVRQICDKYGVLLILDEIQTGLGRTGKLWAAEHYGVAPDIMAVGKALSGGIVPIGAFISTPQIWKVMESNPLLHTSTFGGNPLACAAGIAALKVIKEEGLVERAKTSGEYLLRGLKEIQSNHPDIVLAVRGKGLLIGVEFADEDIGLLVIAGMSKGRVLTAYTLNNPKVMRFEPPAVITEEQMDRVLAVFEESVVTTADLVKGVV